MAKDEAVKIGKGWKPPAGFDPKKLFKPRTPELTWKIPTLGRIVFVFKFRLTLDQERVIERILRSKDNEEYVADVVWSKFGELTISLKRPRRYIGDPCVRKNARHDIPKIVADAHKLATKS